MLKYFLLIFLNFYLIINAQPILIQGKVLDKTYNLPISKVVVQDNANTLTITDSNGEYSIETKLNDSIYFSYDGKFTQKFSVKKIINNTLDILLHVKIYPLETVRLRNKSHRLDSLQNREDYKKIFNYHSPTIAFVTNRNAIPGELGFGFDLDQIIGMFQFKKNRGMQKLQERLIEQEKENYIKYRFNKNLVHKITKYNSPKLDQFIEQYKPSFEELVLMNELELADYILKIYINTR